MKCVGSCCRAVQCPALVLLSWRSSGLRLLSEQPQRHCYIVSQPSTLSRLWLASRREGGVQLISGFCPSSTSLLTIHVRGRGGTWYNKKIAFHPCTVGEGNSLRRKLKIWYPHQWNNSYCWINNMFHSWINQLIHSSAQEHPRIGW